MSLDFEKDAGALQVQDNDVASLAELARRAKNLEREIEDLNEVLKERGYQYKKLLEESIPEALNSLGMKSFQMDDGSSITVKSYYSASIKEERRAEAFAWLRQHGFDDMIKNTVSVRFGRGQDELCDNLLDLLGEKGFPVEQSEKVEPMTLKAWVREQVEAGNEFPTDLFGVYVGQKAAIKS